MDLAFRRLLIHPVDPIAENRLRKRQPFLEPIFWGGGRLALERKPDAAQLEDLVGRMNELEGLCNADKRNRVIESLLGFDRRDADVQGAAEHDFVLDQRL